MQAGVGLLVGTNDGAVDGFEGVAVGVEGANVGLLLGLAEGAVGIRVGATVGVILGKEVTV